MIKFENDIIHDELVCEAESRRPKSYHEANNIKTTRPNYPKAESTEYKVDCRGASQLGVRERGAHQGYNDL